MTGLLGGGHAIHWDAATGIARNLDCFCAVPSGEGGELIGLDVPFGEELVHYDVGAASCAVPGVAAGLGALWETYGRLPWRRLVEPALRLAREGVEMPAAQASCLAMLEPVMTLREGARMYAPGGQLLQAGDRLEQPGLVAALESLAEEGAAGAYTGTIGRALLDLSRERGGRLTENGSGGVRAPVDRARRGGLASALSHPRRDLRRPGDAGAPAVPERRDSHRAGHAPARRAQRPSRTGHAHDEPRHRGRGRQRVRPDDEPRPRLGRLAARPRPPSQQHARRGRPARRARSSPARAWRA